MRRIFTGFLQESEPGEEAAPVKSASDEWGALRAAADAASMVEPEADGETEAEEPTGESEADEPEELDEPAEPKAKAKPKAVEEDEPGDDEPPELEPVKPKSMRERLIARQQRAEAETELEKTKAAYEARLNELEDKLRSESGGYGRLQLLAQEGKLDEALQALGFKKGFSSAQQRWLEAKGAIPKESRKLQELEEKIREKEQRELELEESSKRAEAERRQQEQYQADRDGFVAEAAESKYRRVRELATSELAPIFGNIIYQSHEAEPDKPTEYHYRVALDAYRKLHSVLTPIFGSKDSPERSGEKSEAAGRSTKAEKPPARPGASDEKSDAKASPTLSQRNSAEARGGTRKFKNEDEEWRALTASVRSRR